VQLVYDVRVKLGAIREKLDEMHDEYGSWAAVADELGITRQYLNWCVRHGKAGPKLLRAMNLETRFVRAKKEKEPVTA
jgi:hypothetical protein